MALLATGVITLAVGPNHSDTWRTLHQASFIAWIGLMTIHVIGHALETWHLTSAEVRAAPPIPRRATRMALVGGSLVVGLALGIASLNWTRAWDQRRRHDRGAAPAAPAASMTAGAAAFGERVSR